MEDLCGRISLILGGGHCRYGAKSTVLPLVGELTNLRPDAITLEIPTVVIGEERVSSILNPMKDDEIAASLGMKNQHYAPNTEAIVILGTPEVAAKRIIAIYREAEAEGKIA